MSNTYLTVDLIFNSQKYGIILLFSHIKVKKYSLFLSLCHTHICTYKSVNICAYICIHTSVCVYIFRGLYIYLISI